LGTSQWEVNEAANEKQSSLNQMKIKSAEKCYQYSFMPLVIEKELRNANYSGIYLKFM